MYSKEVIYCVALSLINFAVGWAFENELAELLGFICVIMAICYALAYMGTLMPGV